MVPVVRVGWAGTGVVCGASAGLTMATGRGTRTVNVVPARAAPLPADKSTSR